MKALVIGGGGFLGSRIATLLVGEGRDVRVYGKSKYPDLENLGIDCVQGDISDVNALQRSMNDVHTVFHVASKNGYYGDYAEFRRVNVLGTQNVIQSALAKNVAKLVYTSSPAVVGFSSDLHGGGRDVPYPERYESPYSSTKAEAERLVRSANCSQLATVCLRPHLIFGPGDRNVLPRIVQRASQGMLRQIGDGTNVVDMTYVDNAAYAHLDAAKALETSTSVCAGKAYFISNGEPVVYYDFIKTLLRGVGLKADLKRIPLTWARRIGAAIEFVHRLLSLKGEPLLTPYLANMMGLSHWYDMAPATRELGYRVRTPMSEATAITIDWLRGIDVKELTT
jgi:nucleoside-diphosphate-sugar epimerase